MTPRRLLQLQLAVIAACVLCLRVKWRSIHEVVLAIDHGDVLFADFVNHYYPTVAHSLRDGPPAGGFFYPAGFAALLAPLSLLSLGPATAVWAAILLICVFYTSTSLTGEAASGSTALALVGTAIATTSVPVLHDLKWGQVSIVILAAAGAAFFLRERGKEWPAAVLLGVAAGIKGYPLVFVAWFLARGDLRFALKAAAACAVTLVVLPAIVMGPAHALFFQRVSTGAVLGASEGVLWDFNSQYAPAVMARALYGGWAATAVDVRAYAELGGFAALGAVAALVVIAARSPAPEIASRRSMLGLVLIASSVPFWLRTSWSHYFVHLPLAQTMLASAFAPRRGGSLAILVFVAPSVFLSSVGGLFVTEGWWYYANDGALFYANALVLLGCAAFVVDAHVRARVATMSNSCAPASPS